MRKKYNDQAIKNFVSGKGSVMTEEGKRKAQKDILENKISVWWVVIIFFRSYGNKCIQWSDIIVRCIFATQIASTAIWMVYQNCFLD